MSRDTNAVFPNCKKIMVNKATFIGCRGASPIAPIAPLRSTHNVGGVISLVNTFTDGCVVAVYFAATRNLKTANAYSSFCLKFWIIVLWDYWLFSPLLQFGSERSSEEDTQQLGMAMLPRATTPKHYFTNKGLTNFSTHALPR